MMQIPDEPPVDGFTRRNSLLDLNRYQLTGRSFLLVVLLLLKLSLLSLLPLRKRTMTCISPDGWMKNYKSTKSLNVSVFRLKLAKLAFWDKNKKKSAVALGRHLGDFSGWLVGLKAGVGYVLR